MARLGIQERSLLGAVFGELNLSILRSPMSVALPPPTSLRDFRFLVVGFYTVSMCRLWNFP
jgi:hypothetical protein